MTYYGDLDKTLDDLERKLGLKVLVARAKAYGLRMAAWEAAARSDFHECNYEVCTPCLANDLRDMADGIYSYDDNRPEPHGDDG